MFCLNVGAKPQGQQAIKKAIKKYDRKLRVITKELNDIEKNLENVNSSYIKITDNKGDLQRSMDTLDNALRGEESKLSSHLEGLRQDLLRLVVSKMNQTYSPQKMVVNKILSKNLEDKISIYKNHLQKISLKRGSIKKLALKLETVSKNQEDLRSVIANLENHKSLKAQSFVQTKSELGQYKLEFKKLKKRKVAQTRKKDSVKTIGLFTAPIEKRISMDFKKKGVSFIFNESQPVLSTRQGKIIHKGSLSKYGNVVVIDHGKETRSVLLGEFVPKVKKGTWVKEGQVLGYAKAPMGKESNLYFEVRRKNKIYETIHLLKNNTIAKN